MYFRLVCPSDDSRVELALFQNAGYDRRRIADEVERLKGPHTFDEVDGLGLSEEQRQKLIWEASAPFIFGSKKGRRVAGVFGTNRDKWQGFGTYVPALIGYEDAKPVAVHPHRDGAAFVTIVEYLSSL